MKNYYQYINEIKVAEDPYGEENWNEETRVVRPIVWHHYHDGSGHATVGDLLIGNYFMPHIEKILGKNYHVRLGYGELHYIEEGKFKTPQECEEFVENWWNEFIQKISIAR